MPIWLIVALALAVLAFWVFLAFVVALVVGGAFRAGLHGRRPANVVKHTQDAPDPTLDDNRTVT